MTPRRGDTAYYQGRRPFDTIPIRPIVLEAGAGTKLCWADVTVTGTNLGDVAQVFYGDTVTPTGNALPEYGTTGIFVYLTPLACQLNTVYDGPATVGSEYNGGGQVGVALYRDTDRWDFGLLDYKIAGSIIQSGEFNNFGGGRANMKGDDTFRGDGFTIDLNDTQSWAEPWTPNKVGLALSLIRCTAAVTWRITFVWTTTT